VVKHAAIAQTGAAKSTIELVTVENLVSALAAFNGAVDQLKHQWFVSGLCGTL